jgi:hypothetical protein
VKVISFPGREDGMKDKKQLFVKIQREGTLVREIKEKLKKMTKVTAKDLSFTVFC